MLAYSLAYLAELEGDGVWVVARGELEVLDGTHQDAPQEVERGLTAVRVDFRLDATEDVVGCRRSLRRPVRSGDGPVVDAA